MPMGTQTIIYPRGVLPVVITRDWDMIDGNPGFVDGVLPICVGDGGTAIITRDWSL